MRFHRWHNKLATAAKGRVAGTCVWGLEGATREGQQAEGARSQLVYRAVGAGVKQHGSSQGVRCSGGAPSLPWRLDVPPRELQSQPPQHCLVCRAPQAGRQRHAARLSMAVSQPGLFFGRQRTVAGVATEQHETVPLRGSACQCSGPRTPAPLKAVTRSAPWYPTKVGTAATAVTHVGGGVG